MNEETQIHNLEICRNLKAGQKLIVDEEDNLFLDHRILQSIRRTLDGFRSSRQSTHDAVKKTFDNAIENEDLDWFLLEDAVNNLIEVIPQTYPNFDKFITYLKQTKVDIAVAKDEDDMARQKSMERRRLSKFQPVEEPVAGSGVATSSPSFPKNTPVIDSVDSVGSIDSAKKDKLKAEIDQLKKKLALDWNHPDITFRRPVRFVNAKSVSAKKESTASKNSFMGLDF